MNKETLRMQMLAGIITEGQYKRLLENLDFSTEIDQYLKDNPFTRDNQFTGEPKSEIIKSIQDKLGRPLTPKEKSSVTRIYNKFLQKYWGNRFEKERNEEHEVARNRYRKNLLPLTTDDGSGKPDPTYYELANTYCSTDMDGNVRVCHADPKSGHTDYKLKDKWIDTPVDNTVLNKFWRDNTLIYFGIERK
jgi:hypothetical protein